MKLIVLVSLALTFGLTSSAQAELTDAQVLRPNLLVIVLDDTGQEKLAIYNPPVATPPTPHLTQMAQSGVRFTHVYSNPLCSPTRATIMTGRYAFRTGMGNLSNTYPLPLSEITIPEALRLSFPSGPQSYRCGAFGKWHLSTATDYTHPIDQGFEKFAGNMTNVGMNGTYDHFDWDFVEADASGATVTHLGGPSGPFDESTYSASITRVEAVNWINSVGNRPFFAYVCFNAPHAPFQVPPLSTVSLATQIAINNSPYVPGQDLTGTPDARLAYDWMIESVDTQIGRLLAGIPPNKLLNTTIIVIDDNGTPMPVIEAPPYQSAHAKGTVFEQGTRVPMIAAGRGVNTAGATCRGLVNTVDIWRTVLAVAGATVPSGVIIDGVSFRPMLVNPNAPSARTSAFSQLYSPPGVYIPDPMMAQPWITSHARALNDGGYKYIRRLSPVPTELAFDLVGDPLELTDLWGNLSSQPPDIQARIQGLKTSLINLSGL